MFGTVFGVLLFGALSATGQAIGDAIAAVSADALLLLPLALAAGLAMWGVTVLIGFAKRVFGAAR